MMRGMTLVIGGFLCGACATMLACQAEDFVKIFAFDRQNQYIYFGRKDSPSETIGFGDPELDNMLCMSHTDWDSVKTRLATCH